MLASKASLAAVRDLVNPDYSPESIERLERLDTKHPDDFRYVLEWRSSHGFSNSEAQLWLLNMVMGWYFGEVLVRNLGGRWRYPSRFYALLALLLFKPGIAYRHWYVVVGKQKVPVFELARRRGTMGPDESLFRAYQIIAKGNFKNYPMGPQYKNI